MSNTMEYKGFIGTIEVDLSKKVLCGKVRGTHGALLYEAQNVKELESAFHDVVDTYIEPCKDSYARLFSTTARAPRLRIWMYRPPPITCLPTMAPGATRLAPVPIAGTPASLPRQQPVPKTA